MRVISGIYKRRRFDVPHSFKARPTTDFAKENLFNVLSNYMDFEDGIRALDLFAGTGSISGRVFNPASKEYVRNAEVRLEGDRLVLGEQAVDNDLLDDANFGRIAATMLGALGYTVARTWAKG